MRMNSNESTAKREPLRYLCQSLYIAQYSIFDMKISSKQVNVWCGTDYEAHICKKWNLVYKYSRYTTFRKCQPQKFKSIATPKHLRPKNVTILGICKCKKGILICSYGLFDVIFELSTIKLGCTPIFINFFCVIMILGGIISRRGDSRHALFCEN